MNKLFSTRFVLILVLLVLVSLACNMPGLGSNSAATATLQPAVQDQVTSTQPAVTSQPAQPLPRPTHQLDASGLPKPTLPMPPAQTTRQPQSVVVPQTNMDQQQTNNTSGSSGDFYVTNASSAVICYFFMAPHTDTEWGPDQLGDQGVIQPGTTFTINGVPYDNYDAQALDCDGNLLGEVYGFDFPPNDTFTLSD